MDSIDFQKWVYANIEVKPPYNKDDMWHFGAVIFGMPHTIRGNATSSGGVFYLDFGVLTPTEEEIYISSRLINQTGGYETAKIAIFCFDRAKTTKEIEVIEGERRAIVSYETLKENGFNLNLPRYLPPTKEELEEEKK